MAEKAALLRGESAEPGEPGGHLREVQDGLRCATQGQADFLRIPDAIVSFRPTTWNRRGLLGQTAKEYQGLSTGDRLSAVFHFWETCVDGDSWIWLQDPLVSARWKLERREEGYDRVVASWRAQRPRAVTRELNIERVAVEDEIGEGNDG